MPPECHVERQVLKDAVQCAQGICKRVAVIASQRNHLRVLFHHAFLDGLCGIEEGGECWIQPCLEQRLGLVQCHERLPCIRRFSWLGSISDNRRSVLLGQLRLPEPQNESAELLPISTLVTHKV